VVTGFPRDLGNCFRKKTRQLFPQKEERGASMRAISQADEYRPSTALNIE
jgi:hypothetical protein